MIAHRLVLAALLLAAAPARAAPVADLRAGGADAIDFMSSTPAGPTPLMAGEGAPTAISGVLRLPPGSARVPAMVIAHGSGGVDARGEAWSERLLAQGVATFIVDSFGPRGITSTAVDQSRLSTAASVADALSALRLLATHPRIDPARIGVMGFSKGGQVALYSALEPFRRPIAGPDLRFALHVALYASCSIPYLSKTTDRAPILLLLGGADDYTPADHCTRYADWFRARGADVRTVVFPGANHGFDDARGPRYMSQVQSARRCGLDIELEPEVVGRTWDGTLVPNARIGDTLRACMERGATFGGNRAALDGAIEEVRAAVLKYLKP